MDPVEFFGAVAEYDKSATNDASKGFARFARVDPAYAGSGPARVQFDGEASLSLKAYPFVQTAPLPNSRVLMLPVSQTYVVAGMLNGGA